MKIVSWNCQNGLNEVKASAIFETEPDADIFVIQECKRNDIYAFKYDWKFKNWYGDDQEYSELGIAVFSKEHDVEFADVFNRNFRYVVPYVVKTKQKEVTLFAVWTKPVPHYYDKNVTDAVSYYKDKTTNDAIIIGDFNTGYSKDKEHRERYENLCNGLKGYKNCVSGEPETFKETFYFPRKNKLYVNDFCFVSENLSSCIKEVKISDDWKENQYGQKSWCGSDHCPIIVDLDF